MTALIEIRMPEDMQEGTVSTIAAWLKKPGEFVAIHEPLIELDTDKVSMEIPAPASGTLREILKPEGEDAAPGDLLGRLEAGEAKGEAQPPTEPVADTREQKEKVRDGARLLSPAVRHLIRKHDLDPEAIPGSGKNGRITRLDVVQFLERPSAPPAARKPAATYSGAIPGRRVPHDAMRRRIAGHMVESLLKTVPHVTSVFEMDMSAVTVHREKNKAVFQQRGVKLTFTAYFVAAAVAALKAVPEVNSRFHEDALEIFEDLNIGVGTALAEKGLIVPVIHRAQDLDLFAIAERLQDLTERARSNTLKPAEVQNGTFTISNHGVSGSLIAAPIVINQPQSAILGIGKTQKRVTVAEIDGSDAIQVKPMAYVTLSIDHRALDAFQTNAFLSKFVETMEGWR